MTTTALAVPDPDDQPPQRMSLPDKLRYAEALAASGLLPAQYRKQPANVLYAVEYGDMLGLAPLAAINGIHVIEGKPTASAGLIGALVRRAGHRLRVTGNDTKAVAEIVRCDDPDFTFRSEWTIDRARQAGLAGKQVWKQYPAAMLKARAITEVARDACEEALSGVHYTPEELGASVDAEGAPVTTVEVGRPITSPPGESRDWAADVAAAGTVDELRAVWKAAHDAGQLTAVLSDAITARAAALTQDTAAETPPVEPPPGLEEPVDAEIVDDDPPVPLATRSQLTAIAAGMTDCGWTDRADRLRLAAAVAGRPLTSSKDLTRAEAGELIDAIGYAKATGDPQAALQQLLETGEVTS